MKRLILFFGLLLNFAACKQEIPVSEPLVVKRTSWKNYGCELVTDSEVAQIFNFNSDSSALNARSLPDQVFCLRTWQKPDWKERESNNEKEGATYLNASNRLVVQLFDYTSEVHATQQMQMLRRDRRTHLRRRRRRTRRGCLVEYQHRHPTGQKRTKCDQCRR